MSKRVLNTHTGDIDSIWHTVIGFGIPGSMIGINELFYFKNDTNGVHAKVEILIHTGNKNKRQTILKAGAKLSNDVNGASFAGNDRWLTVNGNIPLRELLE